jgi:hypothetical protein
MRSIHRTWEDRLYYRRQWNRTVLFRTRFTMIWRSEIHISLKVDADALYRRRRRFLLRCTIHHISQGMWRHYATGTNLPATEWPTWSCLSKVLKLHLKWAPRLEGVWGSSSPGLRILDQGTRWRWVVSFTLWPLYPHGRRSCYPFNRRLGGPQSLPGRGGEEKNSQPLPGLEPPIIQPLAQRYTCELFRLLF